MSNRIDKNFRLNLARRFRPHLDDDQLNELVSGFAAVPPESGNIDLSSINSLIDTTNPVSEVTGNRRTEIDVFSDPNSPASVKRAIQDNLNSMSYSVEQASDLSDEEIEKLIPTRYANGYTFTDMYRDYARELIKDYVNQNTDENDNSK